MCVCPKVPNQNKIYTPQINSVRVHTLKVLFIQNNGNLEINVQHAQTCYLEIPGTKRSILAILSVMCECMIMFVVHDMAARVRGPKEE